MKIFIIGASGLIGRTLFFTLSKKFRVFGTYNLNKTNKRFIKFDITKDNIDKLCAKINEDDIVKWYMIFTKLQIITDVKFQD